MDIKKRNSFLKNCQLVRTGPQSNDIFPFGRVVGRRPGSYWWRNNGNSFNGFKIGLYRFLRDTIPVLNSCIWTWSRLSSAPGGFEIVDTVSEQARKSAVDCLDRMSLRIYPHHFQKTAGIESFMPLLFNALFTDGAFSGFIILKSDLSGVDHFQPIDPSDIAISDSPDAGLVYQTDKGEIRLDSDDFYYLGLNSDTGSGLGRSMLGSIPFVAYIEQQLVDDMRLATHNAGYHRLHVQIAPPEKMSGESDDAYAERVNEYFDETVSMIRDCRPEDNPVTWDNIKIDYIGPRNMQGVTHSWFLNHRAMVEEICAGTNLSPFMLGYSYGTTHNWAQFKYDLVMRQVISVQRQTARFMEWMGNIELALNGFDCRCRYRFDNTISYLASDRAEIDKNRIDNLLKLYSAGLISKDSAAAKAGDLI
ncbi:MAG: hypothetical protein AB1746_00340 [Candidatus Zixiibacteriota bacterium]